MMLMPAADTAWRQSLDAWFQLQRVRPVVRAEFDDAALMKMAAASGLGVVPVPELVLEDACRRYELSALGAADGCQVSYYVVSERKRQMAPVIRAVLEGAMRFRNAAAKRGKPK
jgi:LysR family transcriptional activator of nhaA